MPFMTLKNSHGSMKKSLYQILSERRSTREFEPRKLSPEDLSFILWAGNGVNRANEGKKTAPSAKNTQNISMYVILEEGVYVYDAENFRINTIETGDFRTFAGVQEFARRAPLTVVLVADFAKNGGFSLEIERENAMINAGYISQNIYLACADLDIGCVARTSIDKRELGGKLKLTPLQEVIIAHSIGYA